MAQHPTVPNVHYEPTSQGVVVGCSTCSVGGLLPPGATIHDFARGHQHHYGAGDVVAGIASAFGAKPCTPCEARRQALNQALPKVWWRR